MDMPGYKIGVEVRSRGGWKDAQNDAIADYLTPFLAQHLKKSRPTLPPTKNAPYHRPSPWEVSWDKVDNVPAEVRVQFRKTDDYLIWEGFEYAAAEALEDLAKKYPKELEGCLVENFLVRCVRDIHKGVGPSEPRASSKS